MKSNSEYRSDALKTLQHHWSQPVWTTVVYMIICYILSFIIYLFPIMGIVITILLMPIRYRYNQNFLLFTRFHGTGMLRTLFKGYSRMGRSTAIPLFYTLFVALWSLLLIVPGIIVACSYSMVYYVAKDYSKMSAFDCLEYSKKIMDGHKKQLFKLILGFWAWFLLCIVTMGVGLIWLLPYIRVSMASFYEDVKEEYEEQHPEAVVE